MAGKPESYFHRPSIASWQQALDLPPGDTVDKLDVLHGILNKVRKKGSAGTNMSGLPLMRHRFDFLTAQLAILYPGLPHDAERFEAEFERTLYIHLPRDDKVGKVVSLIKADQSGTWHRAETNGKKMRNCRFCPN